MHLVLQVCGFLFGGIAFNLKLSSSPSFPAMLSSQLQLNVEQVSKLFL